MSLVTGSLILPLEEHRRDPDISMKFVSDASTCRFQEISRTFIVERAAKLQLHIELPLSASEQLDSSSNGGAARVTSSSSSMEEEEDGSFDDDDIDSEGGGGREAVLSLVRSHHTLRSDPRTTLPCAKHAGQTSHSAATFDLSRFGQRQRWSRIKVGEDGEAAADRWALEFDEVGKRTYHKLNLSTPRSISMTETVSFCCPNSCESQGARFNDMQLVLWIIEGQRITFNSINVKVVAESTVHRHYRRTVGRGVRGKRMKIPSPLINIKRENLADATDANVAMSAPPRAYKLIVEVPNNGDQTLQKVLWMADILKTSLGADVKMVRIDGT